MQYRKSERKTRDKDNKKYLDPCPEIETMLNKSKLRFDKTIVLINEIMAVKLHH